jgi:hypothetical protein
MPNPGDCASPGELAGGNRYCLTTMVTKSKRSGQDRKRVSKQNHEIEHTGNKVAKKVGTSRQEGKRAVTRAKKETRSVSRKKVEKRAKVIAGGIGGSGRRRDANPEVKALPTAFF